MPNEWKRCVARVWDGDPRKDRFLGSAFLVQSETLLTCQHVIDEAKEAQIFVSGPAWTGPQRIVRVIKHPSRDIALVKTASSLDCLADPLRLIYYYENSLTNSPISIAGYLSATGGIETPELKLKSFDGILNTLILHTYIGKGISGGPALLAGKAFGVVQARDTDTSRTYVIPLSTIQDFLKENAIPLDEGTQITFNHRGAVAFQIEPLPPHFVRRNHLLSVIKEKLLRQTDPPATSGGRLCLKGLGGIGKTTIATKPVVGT
jgi:hypothetical protein